ncbi:Cu(I)/Ag(I) efflux system protein CusF [Kosakonia oryzendophytica]|uniref:Cu(I)/Ag(I) efflux system protein CusF n=1 Tax=Kosakonia oryzendophytica TaxID=1005665 RepID=A0A1C4BB20_9ENTR|nr:copper-binding protein [Kosakonia oryzendophytica]AMO48510.1 Efflux transporter, RND family, MFP subunit [Enterobacter sp. FY-07]TDT60445.1 Cu(I)/Ag(I) efflux system protein CusF [Enterobacter sp. AG5470]WBT56961.1 copper-binding protein [Kosakonia oryzendophytica]SCC04067.1 Cu(I)/Ag(I) efflux system protein CusF [Kosakonia oryzendophytica]
MRSHVRCALTGVLLFSFTAAQAQTTHDMQGMQHDMQGMHDMSQHQAMQPQVYQSQGVVKKVSAHSVSIAHTAIPALNWPPMTMQFARPQGSALPAVKPGDKVSFTFVQRDDGYQLVSLTPQA